MNISQIILTEIHHHCIVCIHCRNSKNCQQNNRTQRLICKYNFYIIFYPFLFCVDRTIDLNMFSCSKKAYQKSKNSTQCHNCSRNRITMSIDCSVCFGKQHNNRDKCNSCYQLCSQRTCLSRCRQMCSVINISSHNRSKRTIRDICKTINNSPYHICSKCISNFSRHGKIRHCKCNNGQNCQNNR